MALQPMAFAMRIRCVQYSAGIRAGCSSHAIAWNGAPSSRKSVAPSANVCFAFGVAGAWAAAGSVATATSATINSSLFT